MGDIILATFGADGNVHASMFLVSSNAGGEVVVKSLGATDANDE